MNQKKIDTISTIQLSFSSLLLLSCFTIFRSYCYTVHSIFLSITWLVASDIVLCFFLRQMVVFFQNWGRFLKYFSCSYLCYSCFSLLQIILMWNNDEIQNQMESNWSWHFRGWFSMMRWFSLFYVTLFLLLCTLLSFCDFSHEFRTRKPEKNFFPGGGFFPHLWPFILRI